jgi:hypothetical protein
MRTHLQHSERVFGADTHRKRIEVSESEVAPTKAETRLAKILDERIKRGTLLEESRMVNGTKYSVFRNYLP